MYIITLILVKNTFCDIRQVTLWAKHHAWARILRFAQHLSYCKTASFLSMIRHPLILSWMPENVTLLNVLPVERL